MINRLILWLSLAGMILALHLWIQKSRGFDQGCLGLDSHPIARAQTGCQEVSDLPASHLLGVSNAAWGYAFYFGLALLSFAKILAAPAWARRCHALGEAGTAAALLYSAYLVYQMGFVAHAWCALCLCSAGLVTVLAVLHARLRWSGGFQPVAENERSTEIALAVGGLFAASGVLVAVLLFVNRLGTRPVDQGGTAMEIRQLVGRALPMFIDEAKLETMRACRFDWSAPKIDLAKFVGPDTPFVGAAGALRVVLFVDPNCPHCRGYFPQFMAAAEQMKERAAFTVLPRLLWAQSLPQVAALKLAEGSGKYFELFRVMFERQPGPRRGMTVAQIAGLFRELGIDATDLENRLAAVRPVIAAQRAAARAGEIDQVPTVYFEGRRVWSGNQEPGCLDKLVERVRSGEAKVQ